MKVYIVFKVTEQHSFENHYGEIPNDYEQIIGVFDSYEKAELVRDKFQEDEEEFEDYDSVTYEIRKFLVH